MSTRNEFKSEILILDYGTGNLNSVKRMLNRIGAPSHASASAGDLAKADKIIMPGVGHFGRAMEHLKERGLIDALNESVIDKGKPILGICLGMELMAKASEEGNASGLGWLDAETVRFDFEAATRDKIPHMGWNGITVRKESRLMAGVDDAAEFYFAHSYRLKLRDDSDMLSETKYGIAFPSAIEKNNIFGVQFHPEKSHDAGARILKNFVEM